ncbi:nucleotidyl cyclase domain-containing protein [Sphingobium amiense]|uniref:hypothetical protein n=1 Tax=Sphingobium amiense TaxID=135719 RepID=UPI001E29A05F|nr:hypothetical protein [Sphingobium amiense]
MLFRGCTLTGAKERLDRLRESLAERRLVNRHNDEPFGQITFSASVADVFDHPDPRTALKAADEALYAANDRGPQSDPRRAQAGHRSLKGQERACRRTSRTTDAGTAKPMPTLPSNGARIAVLIGPVGPKLRFWPC